MRLRGVNQDGGWISRARALRRRSAAARAAARSWRDPECVDKGSGVKRVLLADKTSSQMSNGFHLAGITRSPGLTIPSRTRAIDSIVLGSDCARAISIWSAALMRRDAFTSDVTR